MRLLLIISFLLNLLPAPLFAQGLGPVTEEPLELDSSNLPAQLAYIPEYPAETGLFPVTEDDVRDLEEDEEYIYISSGLIHAPEAVRLGGNGSLTITRYDNGEKITARYRRADGSYDGTELKMLDRAMRCSLTGRSVQMSVKLIEVLDAIEDKFGKRGLVLLSGYRTPRNNHRTPGAARESLHMLGWAVDIRVPGYSSAKVKTFARRLGAGGVGYYPYKGFTHLDVGDSRYWVMRRPPRRRAPPRARKPAPRTASKKAPAARPAATKPPVPVRRAAAPAAAKNSSRS
jgi:uncharacterized protein YcbK (DUF882 family)